PVRGARPAGRRRCPQECYVRPHRGTRNQDQRDGGDQAGAAAPQGREDHGVDVRDEPVTITLTLSAAEWFGVAAYLIGRGTPAPAVRHVVTAIAHQVLGDLEAAV